MLAPKIFSRHHGVVHQKNLHRMRTRRLDNDTHLRCHISPLKYFQLLDRERASISERAKFYIYIFIFDRPFLSGAHKKIYMKYFCCNSGHPEPVFTQYILISDDFMCLLYRTKVHNDAVDLLDCKFYKSSFMIQKITPVTFY